MSIEKDMTEEFDAMAAEFPGFIAASLVDLDSGMTLAAKSTRNDSTWRWW